jgi:hypothetical protein
MSLLMSLLPASGEFVSEFPSPRVNYIYELRILSSLSLSNDLYSIPCVGGKVKKHSRGEFNFEATTAKMQALSYFDQHVVTWQCTVTVVEMLNSFASGSSNYLPVQEHVAFLFDLMELAFSIYDLIDVCIQVIQRGYRKHS